MYWFRNTKKSTPQAQPYTSFLAKLATPARDKVFVCSPPKHYAVKKQAQEKSAKALSLFLRCLSGLQYFSNTSNSWVNFW